MAKQAERGNVLTRLTDADIGAIVGGALLATVFPYPWSFLLIFTCGGTYIAVKRLSDVIRRRREAKLGRDDGPKAP
jgi:hypothetical protein